MSSDAFKKNSNEYNENYMLLAIELAKKGERTTTPNPNVGCVIVREDFDLCKQIVGEGYHKKAGEPHAEINALIDAGDNAKGATAYVTLEPCSHFGKTPPCADALIKAGIKKVIIGSKDANPNVSGAGIKKLGSAGITVITNVEKSVCEQLNKGFSKRMRTNYPFVTLKMAMSMDGKIATKTGHSKWITGDESRLDVQNYRAKSCVVMTSSQTIIDDNPSLNVRVSNVDRQPIRVIVDTNLRIPINSKTFDLDGCVWIFHSINNIEKIDLYTKKAKLFFIPSVEGHTDLNGVIKKLAENEINEVFVEAGAVFAGALITNNLVDELVLYQAPILLGNEGKSGFCLSGINTVSDAYKFKIIDSKAVGKDIKVCYLIT